MLSDASAPVPAVLRSGSYFSTDFAARTWWVLERLRPRPTTLQIREGRPGVAFIIVPLDGAVLLFDWLFDAVSNDRTRITQRIVLVGAKATAFVNQVQTSLGSNLSDAMARIAATTAKAARPEEKS